MDFDQLLQQVLRQSSLHLLVVVVEGVVEVAEVELVVLVYREHAHAVCEKHRRSKLPFVVL